MAKKKAAAKKDDPHHRSCRVCGVELDESANPGEMCPTCYEDRSPMGKLADLDIAIRASGDTATRIPGWRRILGALRRRFGNEMDIEEMWTRFKDSLEDIHDLTPNEYLRLPLNQIHDLVQPSDGDSPHAGVAAKTAGKKRYEHPKNADVRDLCSKLANELPEKSQAQVARDFAGGDEQKAKSLIRQAQRFKWLWHPQHR
ncbi:MAG: hypothetical protein KDA52_05210 [Planctomycetaceae bacterium]|nr:hypothetical protein [Planctomycetaceae bacterium]